VIPVVPMLVPKVVGVGGRENEARDDAAGKGNVSIPGRGGCVS
jgi:hypothetical protein